MALVELNGADAVRTALTQNACVLLTFSAHWCGPCRASKPALQQLAERYSNPPSLSFGIVYEDTLREDIHMYRIRAFPTYVFFRNGTELERVEGANLPAVETMVQKNRPTTIQQMTGGETLGGGGSEVLSPEAARAARIARLAASTTIAGEDTTPATATKENEQAKKDGDDDVEMKDAQNPPSSSEAAEIVHNESSAEATVDPTENLDPQALKTLIEDMGFTELRAQKGLLYGTGGTLEGAVEWLMQHQDDTDIDEPITATTTAENAQSYKCNECGKVLSNMANLELHANKTGHSDFEESTETVKPLTDEEKAAKIAEIKELLKKKRAEREEAERESEIEREKQRRNMGKEMAKTREQTEIEQRQREAYLRKKEKDEFRKERQRLREQLERDKAERRAHQGKLTSKLGAEGYNPDILQHDAPASTPPDGEAAPVKPKAVTADPSKIDEYIAKVSSYKAGGDGGKCLKVLKIYIANVVDNPEEEKYKTINMENKAFKAKVKPFLGAKNILSACGFKPNESGDALILSEDADPQVLASTKSKLEAAIIAYG